MRTNNNYSAPPTNSCRSRCHDTNIIANHTCTLAVKGHQNKTLKQQAAYSNPRIQSHETHRVSTKDHTADIAYLPKHTTITAAHERTYCNTIAIPLSYLQLHSKFTNQPHHASPPPTRSMDDATRVQVVFAATCAPTPRIQRRQSIGAVRVFIIQTNLPNQICIR